MDLQRNEETPRAQRRYQYRWAALAVVLVVVIGVVSFVAVPHHRPSLRAGEVHGVDVSNHQGAIDWPAVAADGIGFAYVKASEGGDFTDDKFTENWRGA